MKNIKKKTYMTAAILVAAAPALVGVPALADPIGSETVATASDTSDIRFITASVGLLKEADAKSERVGSISRQSFATATGNVSGKYTEITHKGITGWVESRFVKEYDPETMPELPTEQKEVRNVQVIASVGILEEADPDSQRLAGIARMSIAEATGKVKGKYSEITYQGITGWVETRFVKDTDKELPEPNEPENPGEETSEARVVEITASLSIRDKASTDYNRLDVVPRLSIVKATGNVSGKYTEITYEGVTGWVETRFVKDTDKELPEPVEPEAPEEEEEEEGNSDVRRTVTASIGIFKTGDANERITGIVRNTNVTVTGKTYGKYTEISYDGLIGWVESRFVKEFNPEFDLIPDEDYNPSAEGSIAEKGLQEIRSDNAYIYSDKNAKSLVVDKLHKYEFLTVVEINGAWAKVELNDGKEGYVVVTHLGEYVADTYSNWKVANRITPIYDAMGGKGKRVGTIPTTKAVEVLDSSPAKGWTKVRYYNGSSTRVATGTVGYVYTSYLDNYDAETYPEKAGWYKPTSERDQRIWTDSLPQVCKDVSIAQIDIKNPEKNGAKYIFSTKIDSEGGTFFIITIDGNIDPFSETGKAIMKHECGHVLMTMYDQEHGRTAWRAFLDRGWPNREASRVENLADCIADALGATRGGVGYGTKCTPAQKQLAEELVEMYAPDAIKE